jgi:hypothetical protein
MVLFDNFLPPLVTAQSIVVIESLESLAKKPEMAWWQNDD